MASKQPHLHSHFSTNPSTGCSKSFRKTNLVLPKYLGRQLKMKSKLISKLSMFSRGGEHLTMPHWRFSSRLTKSKREGLCPSRYTFWYSIGYLHEYSGSSYLRSILSTLENYRSKVWRIVHSGLNWSRFLGIANRFQGHHCDLICMLERDTPVMLSNLTNLSVDHSSFLFNMRTFVVVPTQKIGAKQEPSEGRPIYHIQIF